MRRVELAAQRCAARVLCNQKDLDWELVGAVARAFTDEQGRRAILDGAKKFSLAAVRT
jgi:hypothetical protein